MSEGLDKFMKLPPEKPPAPKQEFVVKTSRGNEVKVNYEPAFHNHFEFRGPSISSTGYRSHFPIETESELAEIARDPKEYARKMAVQLEEEFFEETKKIRGEPMEWIPEKELKLVSPVVAPRPEPKYRIGDEAFELETGRKIIVRQQLYNELTRKWDYLVDDRGKIKRVTESGIIPLPPLPAAPARAPAALRAPRAPPVPKTMEEVTVCPVDPAHHPLVRYKGTVKVVVEKVEEVPLPMEERWRRREEGLPETEMKVTMVPQEVPIPMDLIIYHDDKPDCPGFCKYYEVRDMTLSRSMSYDELVDRVRKYVQRLIRPIVPLPRVSRAPLGQVMREVAEYTRSVEGDPLYQKFVTEEVGLSWSAYLIQDPWSKKAIRDEFIKRKTRE